MSKLLGAVFVSLFLFPLSVSGQSADQEILSVTDTPDPAVPGDNITYTVTIRNNGPNAATNGGMNAYFPNATYVSASGPAGFTCGAFGQNASCTHPAFPAGSTAVFTLVVNLSSSLVSFPDGSITTSFSTSGTTPDPNNANNSASATTSYDTPQIDVSVSATDSPDPVMPGQNLTYTVDVVNNGADTATNGQFSVYHVQGLTFVSKTVPAGWTCSANSAGGTINTNCSKPTLAGGETAQFTVVAAVTTAGFGVNDGTITTLFSASGTGNETNSANNNDSESTAYVTPDADVAITVTDSPDPVSPDGNITYTVTVSNNGPDTAPDLSLSSFGNNNLRFVSASVPAGWNCTLPAANAQTAGFSCTRPAGLTNGESSVLTFVLQADDQLIGVNDATIQFGFSATSSVADPVPGNNSETEWTQYVTPDADVAVTVSDSPDPVTPDGNITYTVTVSNNGPDTAPDVTLSSFGSNNLRFVSASVPAGWNCTLPAANAQTAGFSCTLPGGFASGASSVLTFVLQAEDQFIGNADTTIQFGFSANSTVSDPVPGNNSETESTAYDVANANVGVAASDSPDPVAGGSNITYSGTITNAGPDAASSTTLTIMLASNLLFQSLSGPAGFTCATPAVGANGTITCSIATFANGASVPFTLTAQVDPAVLTGPDGTITQTIVVSSDTNDPTPSNNSVTLTTQYTTPDADLAVTSSDSPDPVAPGNTITYAQTVTNNGPDSAANVLATQSTPSGTTFQSLSAPAGWSCTTPAVGGTGTMQCSKSSMTSGESASFALIVNVTATSGTITSTMAADADTYDPDVTDNSATAATTIETPSSADVSITKTTNTTTAPAGSTIPYTIAVSNAGPDAAEDVVMTDTLPASLLFESITTPSGFTCTTPATGTGGTITCNAASLANGASRTFTLVVRVAPGATSGSTINAATVASSTSDPDSSDTTGNAAAVALAPASADLSIVKSTSSSSAAQGSVISYTINVTNDGPSDATNVVVTDTLPPDLEFVSATPSQGSCDTTVTCTLGTIASGGNATITLLARVTGSVGGTIENSASVSAAESDPNGADNDSDAPAVVITAPQATDIPTLSEWALIALATMLGLVAVVKART